MHERERKKGERNMKGTRGRNRGKGRDRGGVPKLSCALTLSDYAANLLAAFRDLDLESNSLSIMIFVTRSCLPKTTHRLGGLIDTLSDAP